MELDETTCHAACDARDRRYDGLFFVGVKSTGIYCRCVCPARATKRQNRTFHLSPAAAEGAGFRPCLVCRPECAPGAARIDASARLAHAAALRIEAGALEEQGLEVLARQLGVTGRHLRRVVLETFGASPVELAQTHRLLTAKRLLTDTSLSMTEVAFASGFKSLRRFNALFAERYGMPPSQLRHRGGAKGAGLRFSLSARGHFDGEPVFEHFQARRVSRVERATGPTTWTRTLQVGAHQGWLSLELGTSEPALVLSDGLVPAFRTVIAAIRGALDLDADVDAINTALGAGFAADVAKHEVVRLPGAIDAFELAVRAVIGQQVTVKAATTVVGRLTERLGAHIDTGIEGVDRLFPTPERIANANRDSIASLGMPGARAETVLRVARGVCDGSLMLTRGAIASGREGLSKIPGIGPWTVEYIALRGLGDTDAFPLGDSALKAAYDGELKTAHLAWRPWRAYAAARLWRRVLTKPEQRRTA